MLLIPSICHADLTGKDLLEDCQVNLHLAQIHSTAAITVKEAFQEGACTGYIKGFDDMEIIYASIIAGPSANEKDIKKYSLYCLPKGTTNVQMAKVIVNYLLKHPEVLSNSADLSVAKALRTAYPCTD
jgi:hypothetical protein